MKKNTLPLPPVDMIPGATNGSFYNTMSPFEHFSEGRPQLFPHTHTVQRIAGADKVKIDTRESVGDYVKPYNIVTRNSNELFVYGGKVGSADGAYVAKLNTHTLEEIWRVKLTVDNPDQWDWPGVMAVHGNGQLYAIAGYLLAKIDPETGAHTVITLPQHEGQGGAAYNGFDIAPDGIIFAKSMETGVPATASKLRSVAVNSVPSYIVAINPHNLDILDVIETSEPGLGRLTCERRDGVDYIYFLGITRLWRYLFTGDAIKPDATWGPVTYVTGKAQPGTAVGIFGDWLIFQTNFLESTQPAEVFAVNRFNSAKVFSIVPFPDSKRSQEWSKPALDIDNNRVYVADQLANKVAGIRFDPAEGFSIEWEMDQIHMASFWAAVAGKEDRQIIGTECIEAEGERVLWRDARTGEEIVKTVVLNKGKVITIPSPSIVTPGFNNKFYYLAVDAQKVIEMTPVAVQ